MGKELKHTVQSLAQLLSQENKPASGKNKEDNYNIFQSRLIFLIISSIFVAVGITQIKFSFQQQLQHIKKHKNYHELLF